MNDFRRSTDGRLLLRDSAIALVIAAVCIAPLLAVHAEGFFLPATLWSLLMCGGLAVRRLAPLAGLGIVAVAGGGMALTLTAPVPALIAVPVIVYSVARYHRFTMVGLVATLGVIGSFVGPITWTRTLAGPYHFIGSGLLVLLCLSLLTVAYLAGRLVRAQHNAETLDREIAAEKFSAAQRQNAQEVVIAEGRARVQVAQELHDVLAHSLSVIVVQAEGAKALTSKQPEAASQALGIIAEIGRKSIGEVRRIVAVMRGESDTPAFGPAPTLSEIPALVAASGDQVTLRVSGAQPVVPESLGLAAFRVVQESITNVLKHAGPTAHAEVVIAYSPHEIEICVRDDGVGAMSRGDGGGSGVRGMLERVQAMGGTFQAGPRAGGGYEVRAQLPLPSQLGKSWLRGDSQR